MPEFNVSPVTVWIILSLASFRIQRIWTGDSWYPSQALRNYLARRALPAHKAKRQNFWTELAELLSCGWCSGFWTSIAVFSEHYFLNAIPLFVYVVLAAAGVVGFLGVYDER